MLQSGARFAGFTDVALQHDGKLVAVGGTSETSGFVVWRFLPNGTLDPHFGTNRRVALPSGAAGAVALEPDGRPDTTFGDGGRSTTAAGHSYHGRPRTGPVGSSAPATHLVPPGQLVAAALAWRATRGCWHHSFPAASPMVSATGVLHY